MPLIPDIEADIVIAGGGTAGCVVAGRLSDAFPEIQIVIIESGKDSRDNQTINRPLEGLFQAFQGAETVKYHTSQQEKSLDGRSVLVPTANVLGGGTCVNWMVYQNAAASDFDDWHQPGWSYSDLLPIIRKTVKYQADGGDLDVHSAEGVMPVSFGGYQTQLGPHLDAAIHNSQSSIPTLHDTADSKHGHGYGQNAKWISQDGHRSTASQHYLYNKCRPNLRILTEKTVVRVLFEGDTAVGVEICDSPSQSSKHKCGLQIVRARKQIVVSAGAFGTPGILERSGVGGKDLLNGLGLNVKVDLPGVGRQYHDHHVLTHDYHCSDVGGLDAWIRGDPDVTQKVLDQWDKDGTGMMATTIVDFLYKIRPTTEEVEGMGPEFKRYWSFVGLNKPDKPLITGAVGGMQLGDYAQSPPGYYMSFAHWMNYPASSGSVHIASLDPHIPPIFKTGMLSDAADLPVQVWAYKKLRDIARRLPCYRGELPSGHPVFATSSEAAIQPVRGSPFPTVKEIHYFAEDEEAIRQWVTEKVGSIWHSNGTCPMKEREAGGVVDHRLDVYGVRSLKVADLSICPSNCGSNTASVALIIGEKAAELIEEDLRNAYH